MHCLPLPHSKRCAISNVNLPTESFSAFFVISSDMVGISENMYGVELCHPPKFGFNQLSTSDKPPMHATVHTRSAVKLDSNKQVSSNKRPLQHRSAERVQCYFADLKQIFFFIIYVESSRVGFTCQFLHMH